MTDALDSIKDQAQQHPTAFAIAIVAPFLGLWLYGTEYLELPDDAALVLSQAQTAPSVNSVTLYSPQRALAIATAKTSARTTPTEAVVQISRRAAKVLANLRVAVVSSPIQVHHPELYLPRVLAAVIVAALPEIYLHSVDWCPSCWVTEHRAAVANVLHFVAFVSLANRGLSGGDLLGIALAMVAFEVFQCALSRKGADANDVGQSERLSKPSSVGETLLDREPSAPTGTEPTDTTINQSDGSRHTSTAQAGDDDTKTAEPDAKDREIVRLQRTLTEIKTTNKAKEIQLRVAKEELNNARDALNDTFAEYSNLREEMKTIRQTLGKDHQAIIYRKDIELFALRKGNEQKERFIEERNTKLQDMVRQQKTTIEVQDAQLKLLKERLISLERQASPKFGQEADNGDHALEVRLLRVKKGRNSPTNEDDKDAIISKLQDELTLATKAAQDVINQQAELQRAWDIAKKVQCALKEEREKHIQTQEQLEEAEVKLSNHETQKQQEATRLPTIKEDDHEHDELKAMFDAAQEHNLRLHAEAETLEQRLKDSNSRMFAAQQSADALREQLKSEQAITSEMESARPSVVHRVHFQRMEGQLKEIREALAIKDEVIEGLEKMIGEKNEYIKDLRGEVDAAVTFHTQDQDEIERLKQIIVELKETKQQLMFDHERLAVQRMRPRSIAMDRASNRSSSATLIQEASPALTRPSDEPTSSNIVDTPASTTESTAPEPSTPQHEPQSSQPPQSQQQESPKMHSRSQSSPSPLKNMITAALPPNELRDSSASNKKSRRKSLGLTNLMKKMTRKDSAQYTDSETPPTPSTLAKDESRMRNALAPKDKNSAMRPATAVSVAEKVVPLRDAAALERPMTAAVPANIGGKIRPGNERRISERYYAAQQAEKQDEVPKKDEQKREEETNRPGSRRSWSAATKLKRKSLI